MEGLLTIAGVILGAALVWIGDRFRERAARRVSRYEDARRAAERIMDVLVQMDKARLIVWRRSVSDSERAAAFAMFRDALPSLLAATQLARMLPLTDDAKESLKAVDAAISNLPEREATFEELGGEREKLNNALGEFLSAVGRMAPYKESRWPRSLG